MTTPIISAVVCFVALFFLQNVFNQQVYREVHYSLMPAAMDKAVKLGLPAEDLKDLESQTFKSASKFRAAVRKQTFLSKPQESKVLYYAEISRTSITPEVLGTIDRDWLGEERSKALDSLSGRTFTYKWQLSESLSAKSDLWKSLKETTANKTYNKQIKSKLDYLHRTFAIDD